MTRKKLDQTLGQHFANLLLDLPHKKKIRSDACYYSSNGYNNIVLVLPKERSRDIKRLLQFEPKVVTV